MMKKFSWFLLCAYVSPAFGAAATETLELASDEISTGSERILEYEPIASPAPSPAPAAKCKLVSRKMEIDDIVPSTLSATKTTLKILCQVTTKFADIQRKVVCPPGYVPYTKIEAPSCPEPKVQKGNFTLVVELAAKATAKEVKDECRNKFRDRLDGRNLPQNGGFTVQQLTPPEPTSADGWQCGRID